MKKRYISITFVALLGIALLFAGSTCAAVDFPADEAGISAYVHAKSSVNLNDAKPAFATIERETEDYIIGTVALDLHAEEEYPHVYVSTDGWVVAYYLNDRPSSWILPWADYSEGEISSTTLSKAAGIVCSEIGGTTTGLKYYDFRYEDASKMMIIVESASWSTDFFKVAIPTTFSTYAVDWSHYKYVGGGSSASLSTTYLDGVQFSSFGKGIYTGYGSFIGQFENGIEHEIKISCNDGARVALVLEYAD
uniref:Uncharacterized protein n=1 Tax=Candidatus Methanogaster sp. ANME-2c ERB4 TaxID=2759911 RepID=A0A7G9YK62_9EURY|nr:hypothetical protein GLNMMLEO_00005 [Methanosarcinales archaeon ANME-2c ERB4]